MDHSPFDRVKSREVIPYGITSFSDGIRGYSDKKTYIHKKDNWDEKSCYISGILSYSV